MFSNVLDTEEQTLKERLFYCPDTHLNSALMVESVNQCFDRLRNNEPALFCTLIDGYDEKGFTAHVFLGMELKDLFLDKSTNYGRYYWDKIGQRFANAVLKSFLHETMNTTVKDLTNFYISGMCSKMFSIASQLESLVKELNYQISRVNAEVIEREIGTITYRCCRDAIVLRRGDCYCRMDYSSLLMMADVYQQRSITLATSQLQRFLFEHAVDFPTSDEISLFYYFGDCLLALGGNTAYDRLKSNEALVMTAILKLNLSEDYGNPEMFINTIRSNYLADELVVATGMGQNYFEFLDGPRMNYDKLAQLFGLFRHWGHPYVDVKSSIAKNRRIASTVKVLPDGESAFLKGAMNRLLGEAMSRAYGYVETNLGRLTFDEIVKLSNHDCSLLTLHPMISWRGHLSILDVFSDKACGLTKTVLTENLAKKRKGPWELRRTLVWLFKAESLDLDEIISEIDENGLSEEVLTIGVTPKERELKILPRLFSLMSMELKYYFGISELLLSKFILPFVPEITMTDDNVTLFKKQEKATRGMGTGSTSSFVTIVISIDFEKWNLNMRGCQTRPGFEELDHLFGFKQIYSMTHDVFKRCLFYCFDGFNYPEVVNGKIVLGDLAWQEQEGGCEGLRQKGWTLVTVSVIKEVLRDYNVDFTLMGQGDNEVPVLKFPYFERDACGKPTIKERARITKLFNEIFDTLMSKFANIGLPIKAEETWSSSRIFTYGKYPIFEGVPRSMSLKKLSRCFPLANEDTPSIAVSIGGIGTNMQAAAMHSTSFLLPYIVGVCCISKALQSFWTYHPLFGGPINSQHRVHNMMQKLDVVPPAVAELEHTILVLLCCPKELGGLKVPSPLELLHRGFPDGLSSALCWLSYVIKCNDPVISGIAKEVSTPLMATSTELSNYEGLLMDPYSGNFVFPKSKEALIRGVITKEFLDRDIVKNKELKSVIGFYQQYQQEFSKTMTIQPATSTSGIVINPKLILSIFENSPPALALGLITKLTTTKTIRHLLKGTSVPLLRRLENIEISSFAVPLSVYHKRKLGKIMTAQELRDFSWKVTIVGVTVVHPLLYIKPVFSPNNLAPNYYFNDCDDRSQVLKGLGRFRPYFGSTTNFSYPQLHDHHDDIPKSKRQKLFTLLNILSSQKGIFKPIVDYILEILRAMTGELWVEDDVESIDLPNGAYNGSLVAGGGVFNMLYGPLTHFSSNTTSMKLEGLSAYHRPMLYQSVITLTQAIETSAILLGNLTPFSWSVSTETTEQDDRAVSFSMTIPKYPDLTDLKLVWIGPIKSKLSSGNSWIHLPKADFEISTTDIDVAIAHFVAKVLTGEEKWIPGYILSRYCAFELWRVMSYVLWFLKMKVAGLENEDVSSSIRIWCLLRCKPGWKEQAYNLLQELCESSEESHTFFSVPESYNCKLWNGENMVANVLVSQMSERPQSIFSCVEHIHVEELKQISDGNPYCHYIDIGRVTRKTNNQTALMATEKFAPLHNVYRALRYKVGKNYLQEPPLPKLKISLMTNTERFHDLIWCAYRIAASELNTLETEFTVVGDRTGTLCESISLFNQNCLITRVVEPDQSYSRPLCFYKRGVGSGTLIDAKAPVRRGYLAATFVDDSNPRVAITILSEYLRESHYKGCIVAFADFNEGWISYAGSILTAYYRDVSMFRCETPDVVFLKGSMKNIAEPKEVTYYQTTFQFGPQTRIKLNTKWLQLTDPPLTDYKKRIELYLGILNFNDALQDLVAAYVLSGERLLKSSQQRKLLMCVLVELYGRRDCKTLNFYIKLNGQLAITDDGQSRPIYVPIHLRNSSDWMMLATYLAQILKNEFLLNVLLETYINNMS